MGGDGVGMAMVTVDLVVRGSENVLSQKETAPPYSHCSFLRIPLRCPLPSSRFFWVCPFISSLESWFSRSCQCPCFCFLLVSPKVS